MRKITSYLSVLFLSLFFQADVSAQQYPPSRKTDQQDTYHGQPVADPYRWLEDDHSEETKNWVTAQNAFTQDYLTQIPFRDSLKAVMKSNFKYIRFDVPFRCGTSYFYYRHDGSQNQPMLFFMKSLEFVPYSYFDPNKLSEDGTTALTQTVPSKDGKYLAFQVSESGSDWNVIRIKDVKSLKSLPEVIKGVKFSNIAWFKEGFFYSRYEITGQQNQLNEFHKIYYHKLNTPQENDSLVWEDKDHALRNFSASVTDDQRFLIISGSESTSGNNLYIRDLRKEGSAFIPVVKDFSHDFDLIGNNGDNLIFLTNYNAPRKKIILINALQPQMANWKDLIPQQQDILQSAVMCWKNLAVHSMRNASSRLTIYDLKGTIANNVTLSDFGTIDGLSGSTADSMLFFSYTTFTSPATIYRYNVKTKGFGVQFTSQLSYKPEDFVTEQTFYTSKDGTKIPIFLVHKKGYKPDGQTPTLLFGYGGFNISKTPEYKPERMVFLQNGGLFAMANLRGGGEFGTAWHEAGTKLKKQNVFDDFIAAAEFLIQKGYTNKDKLAISGRSNGGLLVGAVMTQRPDLFKAALPAVGVMDMLRYQKFTIGWAWAGDYGSSDNAEEFKALYAYSPYHNLKPGTSYPATLITTGDHDDRVVPGHSFKFAARLQECQTSKSPVLIRVDTNAGHGSGKPLGKLIDEQSDIFAFLFQQLNMNL